MDLLLKRGRVGVLLVRLFAEPASVLAAHFVRAG